MAVHHGNDGVVKVGTATVAEVTAWTYNDRDVSVIETVPIGSTQASYTASGALGGDGSVTCYLDETDTNGQQNLTPGSSVTLTLSSESATTGDTIYSGTALVETRGRTLSNTAISEVTFGFKGVLAESTV